MGTDRYTKFILTAIAVALGALAVENAAPAAVAQPKATCGVLALDPCYVATTPIVPFKVRLEQ